MILKSIKLDNIRSYVSENVQFPSGSLMLSGDIGSGKSTILLAAEFALFGIRSDLRGESLLRHGKDKGSVELSFNIQGKDVAVKRGLKRTSRSVQQDTGHIILDGVKKDLTAVELKTRILDILGYPKELVSKSKQLVYRYTVYTPQEQMKEILFDDQEERLNTLRRVFGVDKYKRIIENTTIITKQIKLRSKELAGSIYDLEDKKTMVAERKSELSKAEEEVKNMLPLFENAKKQCAEKKSLLDKFEKDIKELNELKTKLSAGEAKLKEKLSVHKRNTDEISIIEKQIANLESASRQDIKKPEDNTKELSENKISAEKEISDLRLKINELGLKKETSAEVKNTISKLSNCPVCLQDVPDDYKSSIISRESDKEKKYAEEIEALKTSLAEKDKILVDLNGQIDKIRQELMNYEKIKVKIESNAKNLAEKTERKKGLLAMQDQIKKDIAEINTQKMELNTRITALSASEENYLKQKKLFDELQQKEQQLELKKVYYEKEAEEIRKFIASFEKDILEKEKAKRKIMKLKELQEWLEQNFVSLMAVIEKHIMAKIYEEFNELFRTWFRTMIEDEALSVSLDHDFTPVVQQDGYETSVEYLSGGEKTAIALAYRLSLNKVINDIIGTIKTKDIIILDEPTDGFSSEQLDKVREVIEQLCMSQVIIVSHEPKIEGFVDNILRVEKRGHVSSVLT